MNAPPSLPPMVFRYDTKALYLHTAFGWVCGLFAVYGAIDILLHFQLFGMFNILYGTLTVLAGIVGWAGIFTFLHRYGSLVEIREGKLREISRNRKVRFEGFVTDIAELRSLFIMVDGKPKDFLVTFSNRDQLRFETQIERVSELMKTLEDRSGKSFVLTKRNQA